MRRISHTLEPALFKKAIITNSSTEEKHAPTHRALFEHVQAEMERAKFSMLEHYLKEIEVPNVDSKIDHPKRQFGKKTQIVDECREGELRPRLASPSLSTPPPPPAPISLFTFLSFPASATKKFSSA